MAGLVEERAGLGRPTVLALLVGFVAVGRRVAHPLFDLALLRRPDFVGATAAALAAGAGILALSTVVPTPIERGLGGGAVLASIVLLAWSATSALKAFGARWLPSRVSPRAQLVIGLIGCAASQFALVGLTPGSSVMRLLPGLLAAGAANGILNAALGLQVVASVPADRAAMGDGASAASVVSGWNVAERLTPGSRCSARWPCCLPASAEPIRPGEVGRAVALAARIQRVRKHRFDYEGDSTFA